MVQRGETSGERHLHRRWCSHILNGLMARRLHILMVLWACLSTGLAPLFGGMVSCSTVEGHQAIEPAHPLNGCPVLHAEAADADEGHPEQPCNDVRLAGNDLARPERSSDHSSVLHLNPAIWFGVVPALRTNSSQVPVAARTDTSPPPLPSDLGRLSTIVLLI